MLTDYAPLNTWTENWTSCAKPSYSTATLNNVYPLSWNRLDNPLTDIGARNPRPPPTAVARVTFPYHNTLARPIKRILSSHDVDTAPTL